MPSASYNEIRPVPGSKLRNFYFLTQILNSPVTWHGKKIGKLTDLIIVENGKLLPEVTHLYVSRPFGNASLLIPLNKIRLMSASEIVVDLENLERYEGEPDPKAILLKDHILDKKVLDIEGREVEMVYDVKMVVKDDKLYVSDVDSSKYGLLRRMRLKFLADWIYKPHEQPNKEIISWKYIQSLPGTLTRFQGDVQLNVLKERLADMYPVDSADVLEEMDREQRAMIFNELETSHASDILEEIDPNVQRELISSLKKEKVAKLIGQMTPGQGADLLAALPYTEQRAFLKLLDLELGRKIKAILHKQEEKILNYATQNVIKVSPTQTVGEVQNNYPNLARGKDVIMYVYVISESDELLGIIDLKEILLADDNALLKDAMHENIIALSPKSTLRHAYNMFNRYNFRSLPITDKENKLLGVIPYRDVMTLKHRFI